MAMDLPPQIRERTVAKARTLIEALPFMREHHGKVIVVKYGGAAMDRAGLASSFAEDIALLQSAGITPVVVHGGGPQVTHLSARLGIETTFVDGLRVTDAETLDVATMVLAGKLNKEVVGSLVSGGVPAVGLSGIDGGLLLARRQVAPDLGFVGEVVHVNADVLRTLTERRFVPVVASIAVDETGQAYNVNADVVAAELAIELGAEKLVFINDVPGLIGPTGDLLSELSAQQCLDLLAEGGVVEGGMIPKLESAVDALRAGVTRVHLVDGRVEHSLVLELFTPEGVGTMIAPDAVRRRRGGRARGGAVAVTFVPLPGEAAVMPTYARYPVTLVRGEGTTTWDDQGRAYLDMTGGLGALSLGHGHPDWVAAVTEAAGTIGLVSNLYATPPQAELAARLASLLPIPDARVFFCNSGAEANEAAIKLIRKHGAGAREARDRRAGRIVPRADRGGARGDRPAREARPVRAVGRLVPVRAARTTPGRCGRRSRPATSAASCSSP